MTYISFNYFMKSTQSSSDIAVAYLYENNGDEDKAMYSYFDDVNSGRNVQNTVSKVNNLQCYKPLLAKLKYFKQ